MSSSLGNISTVFMHENCYIEEGLLNYLGRATSLIGINGSTDDRDPAIFIDMILKLSKLEVIYSAKRFVFLQYLKARELLNNKCCNSKIYGLNKSYKLDILLGSEHKFTGVNCRSGLCPLCNADNANTFMSWLSYRKKSKKLSRLVAHTWEIPKEAWFSTNSRGEHKFRIFMQSKQEFVVGWFSLQKQYNRLVIKAHAITDRKDTEVRDTSSVDAQLTKVLRDPTKLNTDYQFQSETSAKIPVMEDVLSIVKTGYNILSDSIMSGSNLLLIHSKTADPESDMDLLKEIDSKINFKLITSKIFREEVNSLTSKRFYDIGKIE